MKSCLKHKSRIFRLAFFLIEISTRILNSTRAVMAVQLLQLTPKTRAKDLSWMTIKNCQSDKKRALWIGNDLCMLHCLDGQIWLSLLGLPCGRPLMRPVCWKTHRDSFPRLWSWPATLKQNPLKKCHNLTKNLIQSPYIYTDCKLDVFRVLY